MHIVEGRYAASVLADLFRVLGILVLDRRRIEPDIIDRRAFADLKFQQFVVFLGERLVARLCDPPRLPDITADIGPPQIIAHTRERSPGQDLIRMLMGVHRIEGDALIGLGEHDLFKRRAFQQRLAGYLPLIICRRGELVKSHFREVRLALRLLQNRLEIKLAFLFFLFH